MIRKVLNFVNLSVFFSALVVVSACTQGGQSEESADEATAENTEETAAPVASPRADAQGEVAGVSVSVDWGSPAVKGRTVWGDLVPYGEVWRAGANETTNVEFGADVVIGGTTVKAGKYGLFIIAAEQGDWTVVLNTAWDREEHGIWGSNGYDQANDVARVQVTPEWSEDVAERLEYNVTEGAITFAWEKARLSIPVSPVK